MNTKSIRCSSLPCRPPPHPGCAGSTRETLMLPAHPRRNGSRPLLVSPPPPARRIFTLCHESQRDQEGWESLGRYTKRPGRELEVFYRKDTNPLCAPLGQSPLGGCLYSLSNHLRWLLFPQATRPQVTSSRDGAQQNIASSRVGARKMPVLGLVPNRGCPLWRSCT